MEGRTLGRYKLIEEIGQGGMAVVWRGMDTTLQREVAVKILHPHLSRKESNRQRFAREARVVATLHHDNIVEIYDFSGGENGAGNDAYIVCEYIRGKTLAEFAEHHRVPVEVGVMIVLEVCEAVSHAHASGVVHRDIKPENVMIRQDGCLKLMDFGIARVNDDAGATMTGALMGSPQFMSPEQVAGSELDARSDLFSIAVMLYRLVAGTLPFDGPNAASILRSILETTPEPADRKNPLVGRALSATLAKALAKSPADRHATVRELADDLAASIADAGLGPARDELRRYFADPDAYSRELTTALVTRYAAAGHARAKRRDVAGAMELYSRVLELDPANGDVKAALDRLGRGQRTSRLATIAAGTALGLAVLGGAGAKGYRWMTRPTPTATATPTPIAVASATPLLTPTRTIAPTPTDTPVPISPKLFVAVHGTPTRAPTATPVATSTQVALLIPSLNPTPIPSPVLPPGKGGFAVAIDVAADILVDGVKVGDTVSMKNKPIALDPGPHAIRIAPLEGAAKAGCRPLEGDVRIEAGRIERSLRQPLPGAATEKVLPPEEIYLSGCPLLFRVDAGVAASAVTEVRLDGTKIVADEDGNWKGTSGEHRLTIVAKDFETLDVPVKLHARQELGDKGPPRVSVDLVRKKP